LQTNYNEVVLQQGGNSSVHSWRYKTK